MASRTYALKALVLRKTKLGEGDLIATFLAEDGSSLRAVAKGARKPSSVFASRLELYAEVDLLCAEGRSLDIVKEARLVDAHALLRGDVERAAAAACMCELLERTAQDELAVDSVFAMTSTALGALERAPSHRIAAIVAGHLLKTISFMGFRPSFFRCVGCASPVALEGGMQRFSSIEGGVLCPACSRRIQSVGVEASTLACACQLLGSRFSEIEQGSTSLRTIVDVLHLADSLVAAHVGTRLKSLRFFLTAGLDLEGRTSC